MDTLLQKHNRKVLFEKVFFGYRAGWVITGVLFTIATLFVGYYAKWGIENWNNEIFPGALRQMHDLILAGGILMSFLYGFCLFAFYNLIKAYLIGLRAYKESIAINQKIKDLERTKEWLMKKSYTKEELHQKSDELAERYNL